MTQRWRKKLGDLDKQGPGDEVFERAKEGPTIVDEPIRTPRTSTRIATAVAAFAVFALAISVFAIPALRLSGGRVAGASSGFAPVWPTQDAARLDALQAAADAGAAAWAKDPQLVAQHFANEVMGWSDAVASRSVGLTCSWLDGPSGASWSPPPSNACNLPPWLEPGGSSSATSGIGVASVGPDVGAGDAGGFLSYEVNPCRGGPEDLGCGIAGPIETVTVYQPLEQGDGNIWSVLTANSELAHLSVFAGQNVRSGATLGGTFNDANPTLGFGSCGASDGSSRYEQLIPGDHISLDVRLGPSTSCEGAQPGYVWGAVGDPALVDRDSGGVTRDPIADGSTCLVDACLEGITAVPVVMTFPDVNMERTEAAQPSVVDTSTSPPVVIGVGWHPFTDESVGWTMDVPDGWTSQTISNTSLTGFGGDGQRLSGDALTVDVFQPETLVVPGDDSAFPLDYDSLLSQQKDGGLTGTFQGNGEPVSIRITSRDPALTSDQEALVRHMVDSISFPHLQPGDRQGMVVAVDDPRGPDQWMEVENRSLILKQTSDGYVALAPVTCVQGGETLMHWVPSARCPDSTDVARWLADGAPHPANATGFQHELDVHPVVHAWDGTLLAVLGITLPAAASPATASP
jgi:hypothetical protein